MNPSECLCVALCVYLGCSQAKTCPVSGHTQERDAIAGRLDEWVARHGATETNVTALVPRKEGGCGCSATTGRTRDGGHLPLLVASTIGRTERGGRRRAKGGIRRSIPSSPSVRSAGAHAHRRKPGAMFNQRS